MIGWKRVPQRFLTLKKNQYLTTETFKLWSIITNLRISIKHYEFQNHDNIS